MSWASLELTGWGRSNGGAMTACRPERMSEARQRVREAEPGSGLSGTITRVVVLRSHSD